MCVWCGVCCILGVTDTTCSESKMLVKGSLWGMGKCTFSHYAFFFCVVSVLLSSVFFLFLGYLTVGGGFSYDT